VWSNLTKIILQIKQTFFAYYCKDRKISVRLVFIFFLSQIKICFSYSVLQSTVKCILILFLSRINLDRFVSRQCQYLRLWQIFVNKQTPRVSRTRPKEISEIKNKATTLPAVELYLDDIWSQIIHLCLSVLFNTQ